MNIEMLYKSLQIFAKYNKEMFYLFEENSMWVGDSSLLSAMSLEDVGRLTKMGWTYDRSEDMFVFYTKEPKG